MSDNMPVLNPCTRCGKQPLRRDKMYWTGMSSRLIRVVFTCHCNSSGQQRSYVECSGVTEEDAIAEWNRNAYDNLVESAKGLIDYIKNKYPGEDIWCPHMKNIDRDLTELGK